jgi:tetratricopeptide (TPR) repeat protein
VREKIGSDRLPLALENFNQVLMQDEHYAPSYNGRGLVWDRFFKYEEAIQDFTQAIRLDKTNAVYWHNRACCHRNSGM